MHRKLVEQTTAEVPQTLQWKEQSKRKQEKGLLNNSILAWIHGCIPTVSVGRGENAMSASSGRQLKPPGYGLPR